MANLDVGEVLGGVFTAGFDGTYLLKFDGKLAAAESLSALQLAIDTHNLDPAYYGTSWLVALPLVMKPTFALPAALPVGPTIQGANNGEQHPSPRNRARASRQV